MKKYLTKELSNDFLLSLSLCDGPTDEFIIKKLYAISNNIENNYHILKIKKKNGQTRTIYSPMKNLKKIQRRILKNILEKIEVSPNSHNPEFVNNWISINDRINPSQIYDETCKRWIGIDGN